MKIKVIKKYTSEFPNPLNLKTGELVNINHMKNNPGWKFCISKNNKGWIPESYLNIIDGNIGRLKKDYNANELSLKEGEILELLHEEAGWYWCKTKEGIFGWYPKEMAKILKT